MSMLPRDPGRPALGLAAVWAAAALVLALCALASFRLSFAQRVPDVLAVNVPRLLFAAAAGAALAIAGMLRQRTGAEPPLRELGILAVSAGAAGGGFLLAQAAPALPAVISFPLGAALGAGALVGLVRLVDRQHRMANLGAAVILVSLIGVAAVAGSYARARSDFVAPAVAWLLGDLGGARVASGALLLGVAIALASAGVAALSRRQRERARAVSWLAFGLGVGAAGPLAFVGGLVPRAVACLAPRASAAAAIAACAAAGAATVVAIDAVPRLLVGGYDFPFNVPAALLAVPIFLGWNRSRLRREVGAIHPLLELGEIVLIAGLTLIGVVVAGFFTQIVRSAT
jgi:iron complex transport system permease protein